MLFASADYPPKGVKRTTKRQAPVTIKLPNSFRFFASIKGCRSYRIPSVSLDLVPLYLAAMAYVLHEPTNELVWTLNKHQNGVCCLAVSTLR